eukprot:TRINITY_DN14708_c0_g1_i1.p2 TRINITY_DN14708_c0_g1~~TRINITY_DN14708_c0_g1_i1.p2  ORF type:complete len:118 (-),score=35.81 TRINITY_DN14708_c0_g1_i1:6-359(-)
MGVREAHRDRFTDVYMSELRQNPHAALHRIYDACFGRPDWYRNTATQQSFAEWLSRESATAPPSPSPSQHTQQQQQHTQHSSVSESERERDSLSEYGLAPSDVESAFAAYIRQFFDQ